MTSRYTAQREQVSKVLTTAAIALLLGCVFCICTAWLLAARDGWIPEQWGTYEGNHGPWRHYYPGRDLVETALMLPLAAAVMAGIGYGLRHSRRAGAATLIGVIGFFILVFTHFWLID